MERIDSFRHSIKLDITVISYPCESKAIERDYVNHMNRIEYEKQNLVDSPKWYLYLLMGEIFELHTWHLLFLSTFHCAYCLPLFSFSVLLVLNFYLISLPNHSVCNIWDIWVHNSSIKVESESSGARKQLWTVENNEYKIQRKFGNVVRCWIQVKPNM